jgi:hypothetical protein
MSIIPTGHLWRATLLYFALTMVLAYPLTRDPAGHVLSAAPDTNLYMWTLDWDTHAFIHHPGSIFDANIYYPERRTLAYSENLIGSAFFAAPVLWLTHNPVLAMNVVVLLSCILCGVGAFALARRVGVGPSAAALSGLVFAFSPPRFLRLDQVHLTTIQWVPFSLAFLHAYLDDGRKRNLRLAAAFFTLQAVTSGHGAALLVAATLILIGCRLALGEPPAVVRRLRDLGLPGALLLAPALLVAIPYRQVQIDMQLTRNVDDWTTQASSFLASPTHLHAFVLSAWPAWHIYDTANAYLFPGYLPLLLAAAAVLPLGARRIAVATERNAVVVYALITLISIWLAAGPSAKLWPLVYWLPGLNFIRVPSRFMLLAVLGLAVLAGIGFDRLTSRLTPSRRHVLAVLAGVWLVVEFSAMPLGTEPYRVDIPAIDRWLAGQPTPFAVAEVPLAGERRHTEYMLHSTAHWQKTIEGYSGLRPPLHEELYRELRQFPDRTSLDSLARIGVNYIVVHGDLYTPEEWADVGARLALFQDRLELKHVEGAGRIYALHQP